MITGGAVTETAVARTAHTTAGTVATEASSLGPDSKIFGSDCNSGCDSGFEWSGSESSDLNSVNGADSVSSGAMTALSTNEADFSSDCC